LALFALLAVVHTWPLVSAPARLSRNDNADAILNEWIVGWISHQAVRHPTRIFDANIFYPDQDTLTYSEPLLVPAALAAPLSWSGASPVLVYNLLVLTGLTLTGWAGYLLLSRWTEDTAAGVIGGVLIAFNAHTLTRLPQLQALHVEFVPLALLAFDVILSDTRSRLRWAVWLGLCVALQALTSYYTLVFTATALFAGWIVRVEDWRGWQRARTVRHGLVAALVALAIIVPALAPYRRLGEVRPLAEVALYSATWKSYLMTPARAHYAAWSGRFFAGDTALFPGVTSVVLATLAILSGTAIRDRRARMASAIAIAGLALSFGPALPGYAVLYRAFWPLQGIRNAARFGYLAIVGLAILAAFGTAWLRRRISPAAGWLAIGALFACANLDAFAAPLELIDAEVVSPVHATLLDTNAVVVEFPFYPPDRMFRQAPYLLHSMQHWRPMLNGYSGVTPRSYIEHSRELAAFPDDRSIAALRRIGVTHVFVHDRAFRDWTDNATADAVQQTPHLKRIANDNDVTLYEIAQRP
jgi:hypothetical protein